MPQKRRGSAGSPAAAGSGRVACTSTDWSGAEGGSPLDLADKNPYGPDGFIFYGMFQDKPAVPRVLLDGLHNTLTDIGIDAKSRGIVFHSWRHYYAARMADRMTADQVSRVTGHKNRAIFDEYADHITEENLAEAGRIGAEVFGNVLAFRMGA